MVMHMRRLALSEEYKVRHLGEGGGKAMNSVKPENNLCMIWPRSFRRRKLAPEPEHEDFDAYGVLRMEPCSSLQARSGTC